MNLNLQNINMDNSVINLVQKMLNIIIVQNNVIKIVQLKLLRNSMKTMNINVKYVKNNIL